MTAAVVERTVSDRQREIAATAKSSTLAAAGQKYDISPARARQIVEMVKRRDAEATAVAEEEGRPLPDRRILLTSLPARVRSALLQGGYNTVGDVMAATVVEILLLPNLGLGSVKQLEAYVGGPLRPKLYASSGSRV